MTKARTLLFNITEDWYFWSHRLQLAREARDAGYRVVVVTRCAEHEQRIREEGFEVMSAGLVRESRNPVRELAAIFRTFRLYRLVRPDIVHHVAIKPVLYGSIAARLARVPVTVNALAGLGYVFTSHDKVANLLRAVVTPLMSSLFNQAGSALILQNRDNEDVLVANGIVDRSHATLIRGSGVDLSEYSFAAEPSGTPIVLLGGRMLWDKGVGEFVRAAQILKAKGTQARFVLAGATDPANPLSIPETELTRWNSEGAVEWWGRKDDMSAILRGSTVACLPSYCEGLPKFLLEAAATGRAIVTTDVPGCREVVRHMETGLLVPVKDPDSLANAIGLLLDNQSLRQTLRVNARREAEKEFSSERVVSQTLLLYDQLLKSVSNSPNVSPHAA